MDNELRIAILIDADNVSDKYIKIVKTLDQIVTDTGVQSRSIGGCRFHNRCPWCEERCRQETPALRQVEPGHMVACHKYQEKK